MLIALLGYIIFSVFGGGVVLDEHFEDNVKELITDKAKKKEILNKWEILNQIASEHKNENINLLKNLKPHHKNYYSSNSILNFYSKQHFQKREKFQKEFLDHYFEMKSKMTKAEWEAAFKDPDK